MSTTQVQMSNAKVHLRSVVIPILVWTMISALVASNSFMRRSPNSPQTWLWSFLDQCGFYMPFVLVTIGIVYFSDKQLREGVPLHRVVWTHLLGSILWMVAYSFYAIAWFMWMRQIDWSNFWEIFRSLHGINSLSDYAIYWIVAVTIYSWRFYRKTQLQELERSRMELKTVELEGQLAVSRLETLKSQLQPHFLFNTLNSIGSLFRTGDHPKGLKTLATLSDLLRFVLNQDEGLNVPLRQEMRLIDLYLDIEKVRFEDHLMIERDIDPGTLELPVPSMLLQPLVENAVRHGISQSLNPGVLRIKTIWKEDILRIEIFNEGPPLPPEGFLPATGGKGLSITRERLCNIYGDRAQFSAKNVEGRGVLLELKLPTWIPQQGEVQS